MSDANTGQALNQGVEAGKKTANAAKKTAKTAVKTAKKTGSFIVRHPMLSLYIFLALLILLVIIILVYGLTNVSTDKSLFYLTPQNEIADIRPETEEEMNDSIYSRTAAVDATIKLLDIIHDAKIEGKKDVATKSNIKELLKAYDISVSSIDIEKSINTLQDETVSMYVGGTTNNSVIDGAIEWAKMIAADDSWTYGSGTTGSSDGGTFKCPICNNGFKKYTCMPFIAAAYAHGGKDPIMMKGGRHVMHLHDGNFEGELGQIWQKVGLCKDLSINDLQPGDVLIRWSKDDGGDGGGHAVMYIGNDMLVEATGSSGGIHLSEGAAKRLKKYGNDNQESRTGGGTKKKYLNYVMRYVGQGGEKATDYGLDINRATAEIGTGGSVGARNAAIWAVAIANDNSFSYGYGPKRGTLEYDAAHRYGCYFCGTNDIKIALTLDKRYLKTYCCNPFIHAAYAHGAGNRKMLKACQSHSGIGMIESSFQRYGCWQYLGKPKYSSLQLGDVLVNDHHVWMYIGNGKIVQASGANWSADSISVGDMSESSYKKNCDFVERYIDQPDDKPEYGGKNNIPQNRTYDKYTRLKQLYSDDFEVLYYTTGEAQGIAYMGIGKYAIGETTGRITIYDNKKKGTSTGNAYLNATFYLGHNNDLGYNPEEKLLYSCPAYGGTNVTRISVSETSLTKKDSITSSWGVTGIAYDPETQNYVVDSGTLSSTKVTDATLKKPEKIETKKINSYIHAQGTGARNGVMYVCSGYSPSYINMYSEITGSYLGSYEFDDIYGYYEIESADVDEDGHLMLLIHKAGGGIVVRSKKKLALYETGASAAMAYTRADMDILSAYSVSVANSVFVRSDEKLIKEAEEEEKKARKAVTDVLDEYILNDKEKESIREQAKKAPKRTWDDIVTKYQLRAKKMKEKPDYRDIEGNKIALEMHVLNWFKGGRLYSVDYEKDLEKKVDKIDKKTKLTNDEENGIYLTSGFYKLILEEDGNGKAKIYTESYLDESGNEKTISYVKPVLRDVDVEEIMEPVFGLKPDGPYVNATDSPLDKADSRSTNYVAVKGISEETIQVLFDGRMDVPGISKGNGKFTWPSDSKLVTQVFGMTTFARSGAYGGDPHSGLDIGGELNSPVYSPGNGVIIEKGYSDTLGNYVKIDCGGGDEFWLQHLNGFAEGLGQGSQVTAGQIVGYMGNTGYVTGTHLHVRYEKYGETTDPMSAFGNVQGIQYTDDAR